MTPELPHPVPVADDTADDAADDAADEPSAAAGDRVRLFVEVDVHVIAPKSLKLVNDDVIDWLAEHAFALEKEPGRTFEIVQVESDLENVVVLPRAAAAEGGAPCPS